MKKETKQYLACGFLLATGLGLCIGGMFLPPLLIAGVPLFTGGIALFSAIVEDKDKIAINTIINNYNRQQSYVDTARVRARFKFGEASRSKIGSFATRLRDIFSRMPSDFKTAEPVVVSFSHNYHTAHDTPEPSPRSADIISAETESDSISSDDSTECSEASQNSCAHHLDVV